MKNKSLKAFAISKRQVKCAVCSLDKKIRRQIDGRNRHTVPLPMVLEWLWSEHGIKVTAQQYMAHTRAGHDWRMRTAR